MLEITGQIQAHELHGKSLRMQGAAEIKHVPTGRVSWKGFRSTNGLSYIRFAAELEILKMHTKPFTGFFQPERSSSSVGECIFAYKTLSKFSNYGKVEQRIAVLQLSEGHQFK